LPRLVFNDLEQFKTWCKEFLRYGRHVAYVSDIGEIVIVPIRSTKPLVYAYIDLVDKEEAEKVAEGLGVHVFRVKAVEWSDERPVGVEIPFLGE